MNKVLVIMATYNGQKYLREQIQSILGQEKVRVSLLVRDDNSNDRTCNILENYQNQGKLEWYTGIHLNVTKGYFDLMKKAVSYNVDYIAFSDQDDVWDKDKLYVAVQALEKFNENIPSLYYCGQRLVDSNLKPIANHELNRQRSLKTRFILSDFAGCTGVFNKRLLNEVIGYEPNYMLMHDTWILKICLALGGSVVVDSGCHMNYRQHDSNAVGLGRNLPAYLKQVRQYLNEYKVELQMRELLKGYGNRMVPEYKELAEACCNYRTDKEARKMLLNKRNVNFCTKGLNVTYRLKIGLNKL